MTENRLLQQHQVARTCFSSDWFLSWSWIQSSLAVSASFSACTSRLLTSSNSDLSRQFSWATRHAHHITLSTHMLTLTSAKLSSSRYSQHVCHDGAGQVPAWDEWLVGLPDSDQTEPDSHSPSCCQSPTDHTSHYHRPVSQTNWWQSLLDSR